MVSAAFFHIACWTLAFQFHTYGTTRFLFTPRIGQGWSYEQLSTFGSRLPKTGPPDCQLLLTVSPLSWKKLALIVPPPGVTPAAPVGITESPSASAPFCPMKIEMCGTS